MKNVSLSNLIVTVLSVLFLLSIPVITIVPNSRNVKTFENALKDGIKPDQAGIYLIPFSSKKDLLVVPYSAVGKFEKPRSKSFFTRELEDEIFPKSLARQYASHGKCLFRRVGKEGMMCLVTKEQAWLQKPSPPSRNILLEFTVFLAKGGKPDKNGIYRMDDAIIVPSVTGDGIRKIDVCPEELLFFQIKETDIPLALITDEGTIIKF